MRTKLLIIDPQNDFVSPAGSLSVPGADADMDRLAALIDRMDAEIDAIHVTLDTHQKLDISHPLWWVDADGQSPAPFTSFGTAEVETGAWRTRDPAATERSLAYLRALEDGQRYPHVVWPEHCLTGTNGHAVWPALHAAIGRWEERTLSRAHYVWKGKNPWTEHFSAIRAEVIDPDDPHTQPNEAWVAELRDCDRLLVAGEALSHCVANTVRDLVDVWGGEAERLVLLSDTSSNVPGFDGYGSRFVDELTARGMVTRPCAELD